MIEAPVMLTQADLAWACSRLEDFYAIHKDTSFREMIEAVTTLREGYGIDDEVADQYIKWVHKFAGEQYDEPMLLGLLVGIMAADHNNWE